MSLVEIKQLSKLSKEELNSLIYRDSLNPEEIVKNLVAPMAAEIKADALSALKKYSSKFDGLVPKPLVYNNTDLKVFYEKVKQEQPQVLAAFEKAQENITEFHMRQKPEGFEANIGANQLGFKFVPFDSVALYVPGGKALYPSTVLMGIIPAKIAGVEDITIITPPNLENKKAPDIVLAMAYLAGADRVLQAGGAQAVLAMAYGVEGLGIRAVDFIYGPGNIYVAAAKSFVNGRGLCGIDSFAGPSEVLIIADQSAEPYYLAHDLLAQAEHDEDAISVLLTDDEKTAKETANQIEKAIEEKNSDRKSITKESISRNGKILIVESLEDAIHFSNNFAPEHLEVQTGNDQDVLKKIKAAGSIFVGKFAPVAIGDYYSGTNHILPTNRAARFSSGVGIQTFYRRITYQICSEQGLKNSCEPISEMSKVEGLFDEHGYSVLARFRDAT